MKSGAFVRIAALAELSGDGPFALTAAGRDVALVRTASGWRAFDGRCPHQGALLGEGEIEEGALVCRNHRWRFALDSGRRLGGPECLASCPVAEREGAIFVDLSGLKPTAERRAGLRSLEDLPGPKPLPILGNAHQLKAERAHLVMEAWSREYGPVYQFKMPGRSLVVTRDAVMLEEILRARPETFQRSARSDAVLTEAGIKGVFNAEGEAWRPQRKLAVAALAQRHLKELYPHIATVTQRLKRRWSDAAAAGTTLDVVEEMKRFTVDITMLIAFGHDANTLEQSDGAIEQHLGLVLPTIGRRIYASFPTWRYLRLPGDRRFDRALAAIRNWLGRLLETTRARLAAEPALAARPSNFIEAMLVATDEDGKPFSDDTIMSNLITMLLAGEDTTAFTLSWAIHELCENPRWGAALRQEADQVLGASGALNHLDIVNRLTVANAVANETMRMRPVAPVGAATANVDTALGDYFVPKGTTLILLFRQPAVDAANFVDPLAFRPERWLGGAEGAHNPAAAMPFGSGPRMCPGRSLAVIEMRAVLATLFQSFDIERIGDAKDVTERLGFTMSPAGLRVRAKLREA
jgi:cytochrome P450/nitrite reductase/ring-hydroxylating ferredoxin subunit